MEVLSPNDTYFFEGVLTSVKRGRKAFRTSWKIGVYIELREPTEKEMALGLLYGFYKRLGETSSPWVPTTSDLLADDWQLIDEVNHG